AYTFLFVKKEIAKAFNGGDTVHIENAHDEDRLICYCQKSETCVEGPFFSSESFSLECLTVKANMRAKAKVLKNNSITDMLGKYFDENIEKYKRWE
ncbi:hypothetical protein QP371_07135, partial [Gardnerella swidsinskii]|nr:hypothetical protein [Gardnerella swidsinskii]